MGLLEKGQEVDYVCSSPMKRTTETAEIMFPSRTIITDNRLVERNFGRQSEGKLQVLPSEAPYPMVNGKRIKGEERMTPDEFFATFFSRENNRVGARGSESMNSVQQRVSSFFNAVQRFASDKTVAVETHGGVALAAQAYFLGEKFKGDYSPQNGQIQHLKNGEILAVDPVTMEMFIVNIKGEKRALNQQLKIKRRVIGRASVKVGASKKSNDFDGIDGSV